MLTRALHHFQNNFVAYLALFIALGGTSYAAFSLPKGSVGARQIRNHSITATKLNPSSIAGSIKAWVNLQWRGSQLVAQGSSGPVRIVGGQSGQNAVVVTWTRESFSRRCIALATPQANATVQEGPRGYLTAQFNPVGRDLTLFGIGTSGSPRAQAAFAMIVCP